MTQRRGFLACGLAAAIFASSRAAAQSASDVAGDWTGVLEAGSARLRLRLLIGADGAVALYSLDQGADPIAGEALAVTGDQISMRFPAIRARFVARLEADALVGTFTQGGALPLTLLRGNAGLAPASAPVTALDQAGLGVLHAQSRAPAMGAAARQRIGRALDLVSGVRRIGSDTPATVDDLWHWGSITKSMTAALAAKLIEQGLLDWDTPMSLLLGSTAVGGHQTYRSLTLRHLFSHRSGLPGNLPLPDLLRFPRHEADPRESRIAYAQACLAAEPVGPAETTFEYSNSGYVVAGAILERLTGQSWETLIRRELFEPLGMASAGFGAPGTRARLDQPEGHAPGLLQLRAYGPGAGMNDNPAVLGPAGRVHASMADLLRFAAAHRDRSAFLRPESWAMLHTPPFGGDYAMGLGVRPDGALWHNGSNTLWYGEMLIDPARGVVAAACANSGDVATAQHAVGAALVGAASALTG